MRRFVAVTFAACLIVFAQPASLVVAETASDVGDLKAAPANTWIKILDAETGARAAGFCLRRQH